jgi:molybdate transport system substrate-binding protein
MALSALTSVDPRIGGATMKNERQVSRGLAAVAVTALAAFIGVGFGTADAAEIHVMISGGFSAAYDELVPIYEKQSGNKVTTEHGPSMGETPQAIPNRLARGEPADLVILVDAGLDTLVQKKLAVDGSRVDLANATIWMAVKEGTPRPDISTPDALLKALQKAKAIAYSDSASGVYLQNTLFPRIDIDGSIRAKSRMIPAEPVGQVVARGEADIGFQQKSELQPVKGIVLVGPIPQSEQKTTTFVAGITTNAKQADAARDFVRFLKSRDAQPAIIKSGMEPMSALMTNGPPPGTLKKEPESATMTKEPTPASR